MANREELDTIEQTLEDALQNNRAVKLIFTTYNTAVRDVMKLERFTIEENLESGSFTLKLKAVDGKTIEICDNEIHHHLLHYPGKDNDWSIEAL